MGLERAWGSRQPWFLGNRLIHTLPHQHPFCYFLTGCLSQRCTQSWLEEAELGQGGWGSESGGAPASLKRMARNGGCCGQEETGWKVPCRVVPIHLPRLTFWLADGKGRGGGALQSEQQSSALLRASLGSWQCLPR